MGQARLPALYWSALADTSAAGAAGLACSVSRSSACANSKLRLAASSAPRKPSSRPRSATSSGPDTPSSTCARVQAVAHVS